MADDALACPGTLTGGMVLLKQPREGLDHRHR